MNTKQKILMNIVKNTGCTSDGLIASDLHLSAKTVRKYTKVLASEGRIEKSWDGIAWQISDTERKEMNADKAFRATLSRPSVAA